MNTRGSWVSTPVLGSSIFFSLTQLWQAGWQPPSQGHCQRADRILTCTPLGLNPGPLFYWGSRVPEWAVPMRFRFWGFCQKKLELLEIIWFWKFSKKPKLEIHGFWNFKTKSKLEFIYKIKDPHNIVNTGVESTMSNTCAILDAPHY
jgi:hypothetical protein